MAYLKQIGYNELTPAVLKQAIYEIKSGSPTDRFSITIPPEQEFIFQECLKSNLCGILSSKVHWSSVFGLRKKIEKVLSIDLFIFVHNFLPPNSWFISNGIQIIMYSKKGS